MIGADSGVLLLHATTPAGCSGVEAVIKRAHHDVAVGGCEIWEAESSLSARLEITARRFRRTLLPGSISRAAIEYGTPAPDVIGELHWRRTPGRLPRLAILVSREEHCLVDLIERGRHGELGVEIACVVSNHSDLAPLARAAGLPFYEIDFARREAGCRDLVSFLHAAQIDLVALARFMLVLPGWVCEAFERRLINVHHALLPSFRGARPHHQAAKVGARVHGATAHFATADLDCGAIVCQEAWPVLGPAPSAAERARRNKPCEARVLSTAVRLLAQNRVLLDADGAAVVLDGQYDRRGDALAGVRDLAVAT